MISTKELVKWALCYIILMVSLSKCEIDSSSSITTTTTAQPTTITAPRKAQPGGGEETDEKTVSSGSSTSSSSSSSGTSTSSLNNNRAFSIPSAEQTAVKTSYSYYSSSSSSFGDEAVAPVAFNNSVNGKWQEQQRREQQQADDGIHNHANIISRTTAPNAVSPILTSSALQAPQQQEVGDSDKEELAQQEKRGQQQEPSSSKFSAAAAIQNQDNNNYYRRQTVGKGEGVPSSSFGARDAFSYNSNINAENYYEEMTGIGSRFPQKKTTIPIASIETQVKPETISSIREVEISMPRRTTPSSSVVPRRNVVIFSGSRIGNANTLFSSLIAEASSSGNEKDTENKSDSLIPTHTWVPAGLAFSCKNRYPGYYADASSIAKCQVYHMCMADGRKYSLLCGIGTVFNQLTFVCDHWYNYKCSEAESDYKINRQLWEDVFDEQVDDSDDKQAIETDDHNMDNGAQIRGNVAAVDQPLPSQSHFTVMNRIRKARVALS